MEIIPYKERTLNESKPVHVYRNLGNASKERYSIRQGGLVVGHADEVYLRDCEFRVSEAGRQRVLQEGRKNVHAYIKGRTLSGAALWAIKDSDWEQFRYDPRIIGAFLLDNRSRVIERACIVELTSVCNAYGARS